MSEVYIPNVFSGLPATPLLEEIVVPLLTRPDLRIERIISTGQSSPPGFWYDQEDGEWVVLLAGEAQLRFAGESASRHLRSGDWLNIPAHCRHRVEWTSSEPAAVWLAVHYPESTGGKP